MRTAKAGQRLLSGTAIDEQLGLETHCVEEGVKRYRNLVRDALERGDGASLKPAERLMLHWIKPLSAAIELERERVRSKENKSAGVIVWGPALLYLDDVDTYAVATIRTVLNMILDPRNTDGLRLAKLAYSVGKAVMAECTWKVMGDSYPEAREKIENYYRRINHGHINKWARANLQDEMWSRGALTQIGAKLLNLLAETASSNDYGQNFVPAFSFPKHRERNKVIRYVQMSEACWEMIDGGHDIRQYLRPLYMPMIHPPVPWQANGDDLVEGGYYKIRTPIIAKVRKSQKRALMEGDIGTVCRAVNALGTARWRINRFILSVQKKMMEEGGGECGIPLAQNPIKPPFSEDSGWKKRAFEWHRRCIQLRGERFEYEQVMAIASRLSAYDAIYFPHQMDFRGRFYPVPIYLNHHGEDAKRGLLEFADPVPLGQDGFKALAIHAANCWANNGLDKKSFSERIDWAVSNSTEMGLSVRDPLRNRWWTQAENPWQFLAACRALLDPEGCGTHLPVQQDGTCNGLQHYAALGRDGAAAMLVNMIDAEEPSDIYTRVFQQSLTHEWGDDPARGMLSRKVVKQPVMTTVYGVTAVGARSQIAEQLKDSGLSGTELYESSKKIAGVVRESIGALCEKARKIMDWLRDLASLCNKAGQPVTWTTPLGLKVVSPYRNLKNISVHTALGDIVVGVDLDGQPVRKAKQTNAFAPNYIHGVDAAHLGMTALECHEQGIAFAGVHDSFWSHAGNWRQLGEITRGTFIQMHSRDLLGELADGMGKFLATKVPEPPSRGDFDINLVQSSRYFFH